jgi:hypothetical protein
MGHLFPRSILTDLDSGILVTIRSGHFLRLFRNIALLRQAGKRKQQLSSRIFTLGGEIIPVIFYGIRRYVEACDRF